MPKRKSGTSKKTRESGSSAGAAAGLDYPLRRAEIERNGAHSSDLVLSGGLVLLLYFLLEWSWHLVEPDVARAGKSIVLMWVGVLIFANRLRWRVQPSRTSAARRVGRALGRWINAIVFGAFAIGGWWGFWHDCSIAAAFMPEPQASWLRENGPWVPVFLLVLTSIGFVAIAIADLSSQD